MSAIGKWGSGLDHKAKRRRTIQRSGGQCGFPCIQWRLYVLGIAWLAASFSPGCRGRQSALDPASEQAERLAGLFWWMAAGGALVWCALGILAIYGWHRKPAGLSPKQAAIWIIGGGVLLPTVGLGGLLAYGLSLIPEITARAPDGSLRIVVTGEQWWWRNEYSLPDGRRFRSDNEVWLPVGEPVQFELLSADVVHSFWIPALGGKVDMIPGRTNFLALHAARTGSFRGVCAEYCGTSHALMAFEVRVVDAAEFDRWVERQIAPAQAGDEWEGAAIFRASGCGACHSVRGTTADGTVGPDLTHFGSRSTLGAGTRRNELAHLRNWLQRTAQVKPGVLMPHFGMLPDDEVDALARYLMSLQ